MAHAAGAEALPQSNPDPHALQLVCAVLDVCPAAQGTGARWAWGQAKPVGQAEQTVDSWAVV